MSEAKRLIKPLTAFLALLLAGFTLWHTSSQLPISFLTTIILGAITAYVASSIYTYIFHDTSNATMEVISIYAAAYTLLAGYIFTGVTLLAHPSLAILTATPFMYFFPAVHIKCETNPEHNEEHLIPALTSLTTLLSATIFVLL